MSRPSTDKRERLVAAAIERFHSQGFPRTSLADVAKAAGMSTGNVFYYFKAKDDLAHAVVDEWCRQISDHLTTLDVGLDVWERLKCFIDQMTNMREMYVTLGCPLAALSRDLRREGSSLQAEVPRVYAIQHQWVREQFLRLGFEPNEAEQHARFLMAGYHGAVLLAYAQNNDTLIQSGAAMLTAWLCQLQTAQTIVET